ncbi:hypothetical protein [Sediminicola luteus]|uniref:Uncharacterized protein n=1 Tax=Sediminicola luteus TaxID=319238 RepID=A0A2A4GE58_9FLAO|nr:hypothetical protein [Sediminicola luteus]PCE66284.1 hypothetical protein B7P33_03015 [Sediminicola luteus]
MKQAIFIVLCLIGNSCWAQELPDWLTLSDPNEIQPGSVKISGLDGKGLEGFLNMMQPSSTANIIGTEIRFTSQGKLQLKLGQLGGLIDTYIGQPIYSATGRLLDLDQGANNAQHMNTPFRWAYLIGYVQTAPRIVPKKMPVLVEWKNGQGVDQRQEIMVSVNHYYDDNDLEPDVVVWEGEDQKLEKGKLLFKRIGPGSSVEEEIALIIESGDAQIEGSYGLAAGHYEVSLLEPEECAQMLNPDLIVLPTDTPSDEKFEFKSPCSDTYTLSVTYEAPGFVAVELVYEKMKIRFPADPSTVRGFDITQMDAAEMMEEPTFEDGSALRVPFYQINPLGKQWFYGVTQSENMEADRVMVYHLGGYNTFEDFYVNTEDDALNYCSFESMNSGPIYLMYSFDLFGRIEGGGEMQLTVSADSDYVAQVTQGGGAYPTEFPQLKITDSVLEAFAEGEEVIELFADNGRATLAIKIEKDED